LAGGGRGNGGGHGVGEGGSPSGGRNNSTRGLQLSPLTRRLHVES
jgi:hypothetical protein